MSPRYFLFGLIRVPMYEYMWGMTAAQIELMCADQPFVAYAKRDETVKEKGIGGVDKPSRKSIDEASRRWKEKKKAEESGKRKRIDFRRFLETGEQKPLTPDNV